MVVSRVSSEIPLTWFALEMPHSNESASIFEHDGWRNSFMQTRALELAVIIGLSASLSLWGQAPGVANQQAPQQSIGQLKESLAANQAKLKTYQWTQTTDVSIKGKTRKDEQAQCRYGADGKLQKTPVGAPPAEPKPVPAGLKGKIIQKKAGEMKDYMDRLKALISHYAPPDPQKIQAGKQAGQASLSNAAGLATITVQNYYKQGDQVAFSFDTAAKKIASYDVKTYLDDPKKDVVTLTNQFAALPDGTNYLQRTVLKAQEKQIQITTTNSGYSPVQ
jgi:hypothetical protein